MSKDTTPKPGLWRRLLGQAPEKPAASEPAPAKADERSGSSTPRPPPKTETSPEPQAPAEPQSWWQRLKKGLLRTSSGLSTSVTELFTKRRLDAETLEEFEDALLRADLGVDTSSRIVKAIASGRYGKELDADAVKRILADDLEILLAPGREAARRR